MEYLTRTVLCALCLTSATTFAARFEVPVGATLSISGASLAANAYDLIVDGTLVITSGNISVLDVAIGSTGRIDAGGGTIEVAGDWANAGTFSPGRSTVVFTDGGSSVAELSGSTRFYNLSFVSSTGKRFRLSPGDDTEVINDLRVVGTALRPIVLESSQPGRTVAIRVGGRLFEEFVEWRDVSVIRTANAAAIPTMTPISLWALAILMMGAGFMSWRLRNSSMMSRSRDV